MGRALSWIALVSVFQWTPSAAAALVRLVVRQSLWRLHSELQRQVPRSCNHQDPGETWISGPTVTTSSVFPQWDNVCQLWVSKSRRQMTSPLEPLHCCRCRNSTSVPLLSNDHSSLIIFRTFNHNRNPPHFEVRISAATPSPSAPPEVHRQSGDCMSTRTESTEIIQIPEVFTLP